MHLEKLLNYSLPVIHCDTKEIEINILKPTSNFIIFRNIGGGILNGKIICNLDCIKFSKLEFEGNTFKLEYEVISHSVVSKKSSIKIISNGGELEIPIKIVSENPHFLQCGDEKIFSFQEFYSYFLKNENDAIEVFASYEFLKWLENIGYEHLEILKELLKFKTKNKVIDEFFLLSGIKDLCKIGILQDFYSYKYFDNEDEDIKGIITLKKEGLGYFEIDIEKKYSKDWLTISKNKILSSEFNEKGEFNLNFRINKQNIESFFEMERLLFNKGEHCVTIELNKKNPIEVYFEKKYFDVSDTGLLKIVNNTNEKILIEIFTSEGFIKFKGNKYILGKYSEIPFQINLSGIMKAQIELFKKPFLQSEIFIKSHIGDKIFKYKDSVYVGNSFI